MANDKGFFDMHQPMSKTQPAKLSDRERDGQRNGNYNGDAHDFNTKGKSTSNSGSDYHDVARKDSGLHGNFAEKDASMAYLRERNKLGQEVNHFSAGSLQSRLKTEGGPTAYDSMPIHEVYKPATSQGEVHPNAIQYNVESKDRNESDKWVEDTFSNKTKQDITQHLKTK